MATPPVSLACCDLADIVFDGAVVERAFAEAIATQGIVVGTEAYVRSMVKFDRARGRPPADVLHELFGADESRAQAASLAFDQSFSAAAERFGVVASAGTLSTFGKIAAAGVRVCLLSVLSRAASGSVLDWLGPQVELVLCADDAPHGFPWPDPVLTAMSRTGVGDACEVAMVSATEPGALSGKRAGARFVIGVASGRRKASALRKAGATHVVDDIAAIPDLLALRALAVHLHSYSCRNCRK